jgi:hypothetical protein
LHPEIQNCNWPQRHNKKQGTNSKQNPTIRVSKPFLSRKKKIIRDPEMLVEVGIRARF